MQRGALQPGNARQILPKLRKLSQPSKEMKLISRSNLNILDTNHSNVRNGQHDRNSDLLNSTRVLVTQTWERKESYCRNQINLRRIRVHVYQLGIEFLYNFIEKAPLTISKIERRKSRLWKVFWTFWLKIVMNEAKLPTSPTRATMRRTIPSKMNVTR